MGQDDNTVPSTATNDAQLAAQFMHRALGFSAPSIKPSRTEHVGASSDDGSLLSENVEACQLSESLEEGDKKPAPHAMHQQKNRQRRPARDQAAEEMPKSLVDPRKYKTKLCRNWKATGQCPYEHTCCYAHGDLETRTMQQNNNVLSSLGYFSGIMLLAMKDEKNALGKSPRPGKKSVQRNSANLNLRQPPGTQASGSAATPAQLLPPDTPTVHSPYCLPGDGPSFGTESAPGSPLTFQDMQMPSYSFRAEAYPKSPSFTPGYGSFTEGHPHFDAREYGNVPHPYGYGAIEHYPDYPGYGQPQEGAPYSQEAHQAAMEKHPAVRHLQSGDMSQKQLQKVLHDIMYSNQTKQRKAKKKAMQLDGASSQE